MISSLMGFGSDQPEADLSTYQIFSLRVSIPFIGLEDIKNSFLLSGVTKGQSSHLEEFRPLKGASIGFIHRLPTIFVIIIEPFPYAGPEFQYSSVPSGETVMVE